LIGLQLVSFYYQAAQAWSMIKNVGIELAPFSMPAALTNNKQGNRDQNTGGMKFTLTGRNIKNIFSRAGAPEKFKSLI
jgi:hypothetical protein